MRFLLLTPLLTALVACPKPPEPPEPTTCSADPSWITSPSMPGEVPTTESFCDFYQFSWQWFLAQASPSPQSGEPVFFQNRVYEPSGGNDQCANQPITGIQGAISALQARGIKPSQFEEEQADGNAVYDQDGNVLYYNAFYSQELCNATPDGFVPGTLEAKVSWAVLKEGTHHTYFTVNATLPGNEDQVTLGLLGLHLAIWTPNHPEMIWATWEHKINAPLCDGSSAASGWTLASDDAAACLVANPQSQSGPPSAECDSFAFNTPVVQGGTPSPTGTPNNVCRQFAYGNQDGEAVNGNDNAANLAAITELNEAMVGSNGLLTQLPSDNALAVWANYEMVGAIWTKDGANSGSPPVPSKQGPPNPQSPQRGSLQLANMSMETFQQGDESYIPNCFGCHNYTASSPLSVSHIGSKLLPQSE